MPRLPKMLECQACEMRFDPRDERAGVFSDRPDLNRCPLCNVLDFRGVRAWAVSNNCQGVFTCGIASSKESATERLNSGDYDGAGCEVVPVVVISGKPFIDRPWWT